MIDVWSLFDIHGTGKISRLEFEEVYAIFQMNPSAAEMNLLYQRYSQNGGFEFSDLVNVFTPRDERYREIVVARKSFNDGRCFMRAQTFLPETMNEFKRLLTLVLQTEVRINNLRS